LKGIKQALFIIPAKVGFQVFQSLRDLGCSRGDAGRRFFYSPV